MKHPEIAFRPIGVIRSGHTVPEKTPIQPVYAEGCEGRVEIFPEYAEGLRDLEGFSHIYLIYVFHKAGAAKLTVKPFLQDVEHGVFSVRTPCRPNPIGLSIVRLIRRDGCVLHLDGVDILDGTPLLDIKPYTARFDRIRTTRNGWHDEVDEKTAAEKGRRNCREQAPAMCGKTKGRGFAEIRQVEPAKCLKDQTGKRHGAAKRHPSGRNGESRPPNEWTTHQSRYETLLERMTGVAAKSGYVLNPDRSRIEKVLGLMTENLVATGKPFCPCKQSDPINPETDALCPCPDWEKEIAADGHCFCRLFYSSPRAGTTPGGASQERKRTAKGGGNAKR